MQLASQGLGVNIPLGRYELTYFSTHKLLYCICDNVEDINVNFPIK